MRVTFNQKGDFSNTTKFLKKSRKLNLKTVLSRYAQEGVNALASATPIDSGETANSWYYEIENNKDTSVVRFCNSNVNNGVPIAIVLQYGHGTGTGGYVQGRDYINPAIQPIFDKIADSAWKEVTKL